VARRLGLHSTSRDGAIRPRLTGFDRLLRFPKPDRELPERVGIDVGLPEFVFGGLCDFLSS
jgi:hypothetical protein